VTPFLDALARLEAVLGAERAAIRKLDAGRVLELALEIEKLVAALRAAPPPRAPGQRPPPARMRKLADDLRRNAVLLAHARDCIRDVVGGAGAAGGPLPAPPGRQPSAPPGRRVSVRG
jgi:hypothetical protein